MTGRAAVAGTFSDYRLVKSRGVLQLVVEIPVERQSEAFGVLGYPMPGEEIHVALARLTSSPEGKDAPMPSAPVMPARPSGEPKERRPWHTLPPQQRAAMRCADKGFQKWVSAQAGWECTEDDARDWLRLTLYIESRAELATNPAAALAFDDIDERFMRESGRAQEIR